MVQYLRDSGIPCMIYYPVPLHQTNAYEYANAMNLQISESLATQVISLPMHTELKVDQLKEICNALTTLE